MQLVSKFLKVTNKTNTVLSENLDSPALTNICVIIKLEDKFSI